MLKSNTQHSYRLKKKHSALTP